MPVISIWDRLRGARIVQVLLVYLGASWAILQTAETLNGLLDLPDWVGPVAVALLLMGLVVVLATVWVQSLPQTTAAEEAGKIPTDWQVAPADVVASLKQFRLPHLTWGRVVLGGVMALSLLVGVAGAVVLLRGPGGVVGPREAGAGAAASGIAVLPFHVTGAGLDVYREGMVDLMSANLEGLSEYRAIDSRTLLARWNREIGETADAELDAALGVAASTGARFAVVGSGVEAGGQVRFTADIYDLSDGEKVGDGGQVEGAPDEVLALVDALTVEVMRSVLDGTGRVSSAQTFRLASLLTESVPALRNYLEGDAAFRRGRFPEARESLERAIERDSTFALAYWRLGETLGWMNGILHPESRAAKAKARELGDRLPEREVTLLEVGSAVAERKIVAEMGRLRGYLRRYPDDPDGWYILGEAGLHGTGSTGITDDELEEALYTAVGLDPAFAPFYEHPLQWASAKGQQERFLSLVDGHLRAWGDSARLEWAELRWNLLWGGEAERAAAAASLEGMDPQDVARVSQGTLGRADEALERLIPLYEAVPHGGAMELVRLNGQQGRIQELRQTVLAGDSPMLAAEAAHLLLTWSDLGGVPPDLLIEVRESLSEEASGGLIMALVQRWLADRAGDTTALEQTLGTVRARMEDALANLPPDIDTVGARRTVIASIESERMAHSGDPEGGYRLFAEALDVSSGPLDFGYRMGYLAIRAGQWNDAISILEGSSRGPGARTQAKFWLGKAYEAVGDEEKALEAYRTFLSRTAGADPGLPPVEEARAAVTRLGG